MLWPTKLRITYYFFKPYDLILILTSRANFLPIKSISPSVSPSFAQDTTTSAKGNAYFIPL
jgi:hypothetical protein